MNNKATQWQEVEEELIINDRMTGRAGTWKDHRTVTVSPFSLIKTLVRLPLRSVPMHWTLMSLSFPKLRCILVVLLKLTVMAACVSFLQSHLLTTCLRT